MKTLIKMQRQMKMKTKVAEPPRIPYPSWLSCVLFEFFYNFEPLFSYFS